MHLVRFHPEVTSCLPSRGKTKYATLGMRLWCKYIRNYLLVYQLTSHFLPYLWNYKEFEGGISDLQLEKYGLSFETKKYTTSGWARGDENVIGIRAFNNYLKYKFHSVCSSDTWKVEPKGWNPIATQLHSPSASVVDFLHEYTTIYKCGGTVGGSTLLNTWCFKRTFLYYLCKNIVVHTRLCSSVHRETSCKF